jgi:hypothetical protein
VVGGTWNAGLDYLKIFVGFITHRYQCTPEGESSELSHAVDVSVEMPKSPQSHKPDGRYSLVYAPEPAPAPEPEPERDAWDAITAVETPTSIRDEPLETKKRSGEYVRSEVAAALRQSSRPVE